MPGNARWRREDRENQRQSNSRPAIEERRQNGNPISVARHVSGKASVYMRFLNTIGKPRFLRETGRAYNQSDVDDKTRMTALYNAFRNEDERFSVFEEEVRVHNSNKQLVQKTKQEKDRRNRERRHNDPEAYEQMRTEHVRTQGEGQNRYTIELSRKIEEIYIDRDLDVFCARKKESAKNNMSSFFSVERTPSQNPLCKDTCMFHLVSVMPYTYLLKGTGDCQNMSCYPAEVTITTFNLTRGIVRSSSKLIKMDFLWYYNKNYCPENHETDFFANLSGINVREPPVNAEDLRNAFDWLQCEIEKEPSAKILCDQNQFVFVYYGLYLMSLYAGHDAKKYFNNTISYQLLGIQDFTSVILDVSPLKMPERWSDSKIKKQFLEHRILPRSDLNLFCEFHEKHPIATKCHCTTAQNARIMHNFFSILRDNQLHGFNFMEPIHELCIAVDGPTLPSILEAPTYSRQPNPSMARSSGVPWGQNHGVPVGGYEYDDLEDEEDEDEDDDEDDYEEGFSNMNQTYLTRSDNQQLISSSTYYPTGPGNRNSRNPMRLSAGNHDQHLERNEVVRYVQNYEHEPVIYNQESAFPSHERRSFRSPDRGQFREELESSAPTFFSPRSDIPEREDWENPQLLACRYCEEAEEYIRIAKKHRQKLFKPIDLNL